MLRLFLKDQFDVCMFGWFFFFFLRVSLLFQFSWLTAFNVSAIFAVLTSVLTKDDWWNLLLKAIYSLCDLSRYKEAELLVDSSLEYYSFYDDRQKRKELEYFGLSAAILDKNFRKAYNYIR